MSWKRSAILAAGLTAALAGVLAWLPGGGAAQALWLDEASPDPWNTPGMSIPAAPGREDSQSRCRDEAREPQSDADRAVVERGWDLFGEPTEGEGVVAFWGTANYDGMCRPWQYQGFVFVNGEFAGTLSPQPMDSRSDGALNDVHVDSSRKLTAEYLRYTEEDPLCCPSRITTVEFDIEETGDGPVVRPRSTSTRPSKR